MLGGLPGVRREAQRNPQGEVRCPRLVPMIRVCSTDSCVAIGLLVWQLCMDGAIGRTPGDLFMDDDIVKKHLGTFTAASSLVRSVFEAPFRMKKAVARSYCRRCAAVWEIQEDLLDCYLKMAGLHPRYPSTLSREDFDPGRHYFLADFCILCTEHICCRVADINEDP